MAAPLRRGTIIALGLAAAALAFAALAPLLRRHPAGALLLPLTEVGLATLAIVSLVDALRRRPRALWTAFTCVMALCAVQFLPWDDFHRLIGGR